LRYLHRFALGTPYPAVVDAVRQLLQRPPLPRSYLVVDQTGVGRAVVDMLTDGLKNHVTCMFVPINITAGGQVTMNDRRCGTVVAGGAEAECGDRAAERLHDGQAGAEARQTAWLAAHRTARFSRLVFRVAEHGRLGGTGGALPVVGRELEQSQQDNLGQLLQSPREAVVLGDSI